MWPAALAVSLAVVLAGCISTDVLWLDRSAAAPATDPEAVELLLEPSEATYRSIARIEVRDGGWRQSPELLRERLRRRAARLGADAVLVEPRESRHTGAGHPRGATLYYERTLAGTAIVFHAPPAGGDPPGDDR